DRRPRCAAGARTATTGRARRPAARWPRKSRRSPRSTPGSTRCASASARTTRRSARRGPPGRGPRKRRRGRAVASTRRRGGALSRGEWLRRAGPAGKAAREDLARQLQPHELAALGSYYWEGWARDAQLPPGESADEPRRTWLICAVRGFGKTRAGAEWVRDVARRDGSARIALVGASLAEARSVMVEGDSGVLAAAPGALAPVFEPSLRKLTWENGAVAWLYSAGEPETLR